MNADEALRDRVIRKLGRLTEITRILDRNGDDSATWREDPDGEFLYVFDTNVIQMFLEPFRNPQYAEVFHAGVWGRDYEKYDIVNQQSCLLISEYMVSGHLPGQKGDKLYMSLPHYRELQIQIGILRKQVLENARRLRQDDQFHAEAAQPLLALKEVLALDSDVDRSRFVDLALEHEPDRRDLADFAAMPDAAFQDLAASVRSREICRLLALDRIFEPADQIQRFLSRAVAGRLRPIEQEFRPSRKDLAILDQERANWEDYLRGAIRARPRGSRTSGALKADCETLAHLTWAMRERVDRHKTVVLVTGDKALYDAYRRRHVEEPDGLPFLLRPLTQYAPLFNPEDAKSVVSEKKGAFDKVREAVEAGTVALNLGLISGKSEDSAAKARARDHFILISEHSLESAGMLLKRFFPRFSDNEWLREQDKKLDQLVKPLQRVERLMLGAYPELIAPRLEQDRDDFLLAASRGDNHALAAALYKRLDEARDNGFLFSLPLMPEQVADLVATIQQRGRPVVERASVNVRLRFPVGSGKQLSHPELIEELGRRRDDLPAIIDELAKTPARIFALAALLAFSLELWTEAGRLAELAARASEAAPGEGGGDGVSEDDYAEYLYLKGASLRFRLAAHRPDPETTFHDPWSQWLAESERALSTCIERHQEKDQLPQLIRALSERAAARLSYCAWSAFGQLRDLNVQKKRENPAPALFGAVVEDFAECERLTAAAEKQVATAELDREAVQGILFSATRQYRVNAIGARFIGAALADKGMLPEAELEAGLSRLSGIEPIENRDLPAIASAYLLAAAGRYEELDGLKVADLTLPLDIDIIKGLKARSPAQPDAAV